MITVAACGTCRLGAALEISGTLCKIIEASFCGMDLCRFLLGEASLSISIRGRYMYHATMRFYYEKLLYKWSLSVLCVTKRCGLIAKSFSISGFYLCCAYRRFSTSGSLPALCETKKLLYKRCFTCANRQCLAN